MPWFRSNQDNSPGNMTNDILKMLIRDFKWYRFNYKLIGLIVNLLKIALVINMTVITFVDVDIWVYVLALVLYVISSVYDLPKYRRDIKDRVNQLFKIITKLSTNNTPENWDNSVKEIMENGLLLGIGSTDTLNIVDQLTQRPGGANLMQPLAGVSAFAATTLGNNYSNIRRNEILSPQSNVPIIPSPKEPVLLGPTPSIVDSGSGLSNISVTLS